jgi:signal transduction histidine kinase
MTKIFSNRKTKYLFFFIILFTCFLISAIVSPILVENQKSNWESILIDNIEYNTSKINEAIKSKTETLIGCTKKIKLGLINLLSSQKYDRGKLFQAIEHFSNDNIVCEVYDNNFELVAWNSSPVIEKQNLADIKSRISQSFFIDKKLIAYLSFADSLNAGNHSLILLVSQPVEKHYSLSKEYLKEINLSESLSKILSVSVKIDYNSSAIGSKDGRKYSSIITNNHNNKIGVATFDKPALETAVENIQNQISLIQSLIIFVSLILTGLYSRRHFQKITNKFIKIILLAFYLTILRLALFYFEIPFSMVHNTLTDSSYFSSVFGYGIVRSPIELTITLSFLLIVIFYTYQTAQIFFKTNANQNKNLFLTLIVVISALLFYFLVYRGFGASLRSVIFDSSIRYFRDFSLFPALPVLVMCLNILMLGIIVIMVSILLWLFILQNLQSGINKNKIVTLLMLLVSVQIAGWIFDIVQSEPQGTPLIRIIFVTISFLVSCWLYFRKQIKPIQHFIYVSLTASIFSVSLLTYYNSELERESLKTTAQEITRTDERLIEFYIYQTLKQTSSNELTINSLLGNSNMDSDAFICWTNSMLYMEGIPAEISFYSFKKNLLGYFSSSINSIRNFISQAQPFPDTLVIRKFIEPYTGRQNFIGTMPIKFDEMVIGYAKVVVMNDKNYFNFTNMPKFLIPRRAGILSAVDYEKLNLFEFQDGVLSRSYGDKTLSEAVRDSLTSSKFTEYNEAWVKLKLDNENHLIYLSKKQNHVQNKILAVAMEEKNFSWNLSDFFKIFFIHTTLIVAILFVVSLIKYRSSLIIISQYKTRLIGAFLIVSIIPLILVAVYFRNLTETKNSELVSKRLTELARQVESYLKYYSTTSFINQTKIFEKAGNDLNISFSVYVNANLFFSSNKIIYDSGLLSKTIQPQVFIHSILNSDKIVFTKENFESIPVNSIYLRAELSGINYIICISDLFNTVSLPLSGIELDIFLFGIFSLAVILLFVFSTFLADQISSPIRKLTGATNSVGSGDLNVEIVYKRTGEIKNLIDGFNSMVRRIRQSQIELTRLERETAWKEMAKQVAHEIKNPLTPMKLNIQQLITAHKDKSPKFDSIFEKVTSIIISQIDILKNIASEFSNFARMPRLNISKLNAVSVTNEAVSLFSEESIQIKFVADHSSIIINADEEQLKRTIVNLIRNSIQAKANKLTVSISLKEDLCEIKVEDNGTGISEENINKVFDENFTTKKSGMGIGLSMAKRFIESVNGNIAVEKTSTEGTTILITIPIAG